MPMPGAAPNATICTASPAVSTDPLTWISTQQVKATSSHGLRVRDTSDVQECASVTARRRAVRGAISLRRLLTVFVIGP